MVMQRWRENGYRGMWLKFVVGALVKSERREALAGQEKLGPLRSKNVLETPQAWCRLQRHKNAEKCLANARGTSPGLVGPKLATGVSEQQDLLLFQKHPAT
ncbi:hypothetical protein N2152v2_011076 [Parachlorella kessleri]